MNILDSKIEEACLVLKNNKLPDISEEILKYWFNSYHAYKISAWHIGAGDMWIMAFIKPYKYISVARYYADAEKFRFYKAVNSANTKLYEVDEEMMLRLINLQVFN